MKQAGSMKQLDEFDSHKDTSKKANSQARRWLDVINTIKKINNLFSSMLILSKVLKTIILLLINTINKIIVF